MGHTARVVLATILLGAILGCGGEKPKKKGFSKVDPEDVYVQLGDGSGPESRPIRELAEEVGDCLISRNFTHLQQLMPKQARVAKYEDRLWESYEKMEDKVPQLTAFRIVEIHRLRFWESSISKEYQGPRPFRGESNFFGGPVDLTSPWVGRVAIVLGLASTEVPDSQWVTQILAFENNAWRLVSVRVQEARVAGRDFRWFIEQADAEDAAGHHRVAVLYRELAVRLASPSRFIHPIGLIQNLLPADRPLPPNLPAFPKVPAERWQITPERGVNVLRVSPGIEEDRLLIEVRYDLDHGVVVSLESTAEREALAAYVREHFPEYANAFETIRVISVVPEGKGEYSEDFPVRLEATSEQPAETVPPTEAPPAKFAPETAEDSTHESP